MFFAHYHKNYLITMENDFETLNEKFDSVLKEIQKMKPIEIFAFLDVKK